jgi:eukaryotic-like serine/threonine-protein kinase
MVLSPGARLGPYEIREPLGKGGMGEVYRVTDTRLDRTLAVKVLPPDLAGDPARRARFDREARAVASLNHPHICSLHDIGHDRGLAFLVLEYIDAPTLAERLVAGPLSLTDSLNHAIALADALDHAHRHGVVHRDLKPGNIMLTKAGVKILDFGLASLRAIDSLPAVQTIASARGQLTSANRLLGTLQYMAPEQLAGRGADARTDLFALGAVIYEMLTGSRPFRADTDAATIGAILHTDPVPVAALGPGIPSDLNRVVMRCLAKSPEDRWQTARDLVLELRAIAEGDRPAAVRGRSTGRRPMTWVAGVLALSTVFLLAVLLRQSPLDQRVVHLSIPLEETARHFSLSPDGRALAFSSGGTATTRLWIRPLATSSSRPLDGTDGAEFPFWSPDGRFVAFAANGKLKKVAVAGGPVQTLCDAPALLGGAWSRDDVIVFAPGNRTPLFRVSAAGGEPAALTRLDQSRGQNTHRWPSFLPDGRHFLYLARSTRPEDSGVYVGSLDSPAVVRVMSSESRASFGSPGYLLFARDRALVAQPFDTASLGVTGEVVEVVEDLQFSKADGYGTFTVSEHGELAFQSGAVAAPRSELAWFDRSGRRLHLPVVPGNVADPSIAPDGTRVAVMKWENMTSNIWMVDLERGATSPLTSHPAVDWSPVWSPDGDSVVFSSNRDGPGDLYRATLGGDEQAVLKSAAVKSITDWTAESRLIVYASRDQQKDRNLWTLSEGSGAPPAMFAEGPFEETLGRLSPDGRWMAFVSDKSGRDEVYVRPFPSSAGEWQISTAGGTEPRWNRNGRELFYYGRTRS